MTSHKHLKSLVRARMEKTGERYAAARRHVAEAAGQAAPPGAGAEPDGLVPATNALRIALAAAGVTGPGGRPFSEAMLFGIAGGIGIGVFSFVYEKEDFASFFVGARHLWHDDAAYLRAAFARLGVIIAERETSGPAAALRHLKEGVATGRPVIVFVEAGLLPYRREREELLGGGSHVITVLGVDEAAGTAKVLDRGGEAFALPLATLAQARGRIRKAKHRLMWVETAGKVPPLAALVREGLAACRAGLEGEGDVPGARANFALSALEGWADRLTGAGKSSWATAYPPGPRLWNALTMLCRFIEHHGTGGGLARPLFAAALAEAAASLRDDRLATLAAGYEAVGREWSALARAALHDGVPAFRKARQLMDRQAALRTPDDAAEALQIADNLHRLGEETGRHFPLSEAQAAGLREDMATRVRRIHADEVRLHTETGRWLEA